MKYQEEILAAFGIDSQSTIAPFGNGLINDTYLVRDKEGAPRYVLQRINTDIFTDPAALQDNIEKTTEHIGRKLKASGIADTSRKVLHFVPCPATGKTYYTDADGKVWRMSDYIANSTSPEKVDADSSYLAGKAFGKFQSMLADIPEELHETIPGFHDMELRLRQFREAVDRNAAGRAAEVTDMIAEVEAKGQSMCVAEELHRQGKLPKRVCHCDTKVNNMLFDSNDGSFLCVIDLDTVMPSYIFSDYGDFLRTAANTAPEDEPDLSKIAFRKDIFEAFTRGYLESADFLTQTEKENLPFAVALFPFMQAVRFLTDYINGDKYYRISYPEHNLVRARAQFELFHKIENVMPEIKQFIKNF